MLSTMFIKPEISLVESPEHGARTLPELVRFHIENNPNYEFCTQAERSATEEGHTYMHVTYRHLEQAICHCQSWIVKNIQDIHSPTRGQNGKTTKFSPVALLMDSDLGLAVYILTLMGMGVPIVLLSARLSPLAVRHLLQKTGASAALVSRNLYSVLSEALGSTCGQDINGNHQLSSTDPEGGNTRNETSITQVHIAAGYRSFIDNATSTTAAVYHTDHFISETDREVLILHSSGTSGLPKPIYCSHRHFLGFSQCHTFDSDSQEQASTISTSPFFHVSALLQSSSCNSHWGNRASESFQSVCL